jgi:hypothetical protein
MVSTQEVAERVVAWANGVSVNLTVPFANTYSWTPSGKGALPDCAVDVSGIELLIDDDRRFPWLSIQQTVVRVFTLDLSFMVDNTDEEAASIYLRSVADALTASLLSDGTLGGTVPMASPLLTFDFSRPYVRYQDGTKGREVVAQMFVADPMEAS